MSSNPWYPWYPADFRTKTSRLTYVESGAYRRMLDDYYATATPLPLEHDRIYRSCHAQNAEERAAIDYVLSIYFVKQSDGYHNKRADKEIAKQQEFSRQQSLRAHKRWDSSGNASASAGAMPESCLSQPQPHITTTVIPTVTTKRSKAEARATRLSTDWNLPVEWAVWAMDKRRWSNPKIYEVAEQFKDWWIAKAGKDGAKLDWFATWRTWVRNQRDGGSVSVADGNRKAVAEFLALQEKTIEGETLEN